MKNWDLNSGLYIPEPVLYSLPDTTVLLSDKALVSWAIGTDAVGDPVEHLEGSFQLIVFSFSFPDFIMG